MLLQHLLLSWNSSMRRFMSARQTLSSSVQESGGRPPLLSPKLIAPLVGWNLMPISLQHIPHAPLTDVIKHTSTPCSFRGRDAHRINSKSPPTLGKPIVPTACQHVTPQIQPSQGCLMFCSIVKVRSFPRIYPDSLKQISSLLYSSTMVLQSGMYFPFSSSLYSKSLLLKG